MYFEVINKVVKVINIFIDLECIIIYDYNGNS